MSPAHLQQYASTGQLSESLPSSQVNLIIEMNANLLLLTYSLALSSHTHTQQNYQYLLILINDSAVDSLQIYISNNCV